MAARTSARTFGAVLTRIKILHRKGHLLHGTGLPAARSIQMLDLIMLAIGLGFFALSVGYAYACDRL